jgi:hypothetical protein
MPAAVRWAGAICSDVDVFGKCLQLWSYGWICMRKDASDSSWSTVLATLPAHSVAKDPVTGYSNHFPV